MSSRLALHLLGAPQLSLDKTPLTAERRKAVALLAYLAVNRGLHTRETLSALLWPDYEQSKAFANLRHTLWENQQTIGEGLLDTSRDQIGLNEQAATLIGWADATRERIINPRPYLEQANLDRDIAAIMAKIGSSSFEVANDAGREMTIDEAAGYALKENHE